MKNEGRTEGRAESVLEILRKLDGELPVSIEEKILSEKDLEVLTNYLIAAANAKSVEDFLEQVQLLQ